MHVTFNLLVCLREALLSTFLSSYGSLASPLDSCDCQRWLHVTTLLSLVWMNILWGACDLLLTNVFVQCCLYHNCGFLSMLNILTGPQEGVRLLGGGAWTSLHLAGQQEVHWWAQRQCWWARLHSCHEWVWRLGKTALIKQVPLNVSSVV